MARVNAKFWRGAIFWPRRVVGIGNNPPIRPVPFLSDFVLGRFGHGGKVEGRLEAGKVKGRFGANMELIWFWVICGVASWFIAAQRGGAGCLWFLLGLLLGPIALLMAFAIKPKG